MKIETLNIDALDILDLEYDVAGLGASESSNSEVNHAAHGLVMYRLPTSAH